MREVEHKTRDAPVNLEKNMLKAMDGSGGVTPRVIMDLTRD